jgi:prefoldin subunit 5
MTLKVDQFYDKLRDRLNLVDGGLQSLKVSFQSLPAKSEQSLRACLESVKNQFQAGKDQAMQIQANVSAHVEQKLVETKEAISGWKMKKETKNLCRRADRSEAHAVDAIDYALAAIGRAEEAILEAAIAHIDAIEAQSPDSKL